MNDTFAEQLVKKNHSSSDSMKKTAIIIGGGLLTGVLLIASVTNFLLLIFPAVTGFLMYRLLTGLDVEYEYTITNGTLDIDKIIAKRKRVNMISAEVKDFTGFARLSGDEAEDFGGTRIHAAGGGEALVYADFHSDNYGEVRLVFSPDERVLGCIKPYLPAKLRNFDR